MQSLPHNIAIPQYHDRTLGAKGTVIVQPEWTSGYVAEIDYTHGYYREMSPAHLRFALISRGFAPPPASDIRYLELGFGQGLSLNLHAAANRGQFWGTDFNPSQAANAQALAAATGNGTHILDDGFAELLARDDLPQFDYICAHGVWTWVSEENRANMVALMRKLLKLGGAVYLSYNALPGWAQSMPLRELMKLHEDIAGSQEKGIGDRISNAIGFGEAMEAAGALYFRQAPAARERLKSLKGKPVNYLAHEYFNRDWKPMYFADVAKMLESGAKLGFGGSSNLLDHVDAINLNEAARNFLAGIANPVLRETARDYLLNQVFRRDIYLRGGRRLTIAERNALLSETRVALLTLPDDIPMKLTSALGEINLAEQIYKPLLQTLAADNYKPKTLAEIAAARPDTNQAQIVQAITLLIGANHLGVAQSPAEEQACRAGAQRFNNYVLARARQVSEINYLASPVLGGAVTVQKLPQMFLLAQAEGAKTPPVLAKAVYAMMNALGQKIFKDGQPLESDEAHLAQLTEDAKAHQRRLPLMQALGVVK